MTTYTTLQSPLGELLLVGGESGLASLSMPGQRGAPAVRPEWRRDDAAFAEAAEQLSAYFAGRLTRFELRLAADGTDFRQRVWQALDDVPYGTTTTYGAVWRGPTPRRWAPHSVPTLPQCLKGLGDPQLIVRPCHRVIGADGSMRGYAGGVERKVRLLTLEGALQPMLG
ncbi:methylated-DNA--[protein]-cysteine S-methyltransferase [Streptomyces sp. NBC_00019]|uniref:methylated-DNA--[protein]-cysteine S-methyltransferase n=1 Tax=Streptomyces sp. NBC_00019 TaxID=2975623 RepID=UPI00324DAAA7